MAESKWGRLRHLLLEGFVIVFSVLVALFVEDLRSERQASNEVAEALAALDVEVRANLEELEAFGAGAAGGTGVHHGVYGEALIGTPYH